MFGAVITFWIKHAVLYSFGKTSFGLGKSYISPSLWPCDITSVQISPCSSDRPLFPQFLHRFRFLYLLHAVARVDVIQFPLASRLHEHAVRPQKQRPAAAVASQRAQLRHERGREQRRVAPPLKIGRAHV